MTVYAFINLDGATDTTPWYRLTDIIREFAWPLYGSSYEQLVDEDGDAVMARQDYLFHDYDTELYADWPALHNTLVTEQGAYRLAQMDAVTEAGLRRLAVLLATATVTRMRPVERET